MIKVQLLHENARIPSKAHTSDAGFDLYSIEDFVLCSGDIKLCRIGIKVAIPTGYVGLLRGRSGLASGGVDIYEFFDPSVHNEIHLLGGVIDSSYRGEWGIILKNLGPSIKEFKKGDKLAQVIIIPIYDGKMVESDDLDSTDRGDKGFGSSDFDPSKYIK